MLRCPLDIGPTRTYGHRSPISTCALFHQSHDMSHHPSNALWSLTIASSVALEQLSGDSNPPSLLFALVGALEEDHLRPSHVQPPNLFAPIHSLSSLSVEWISGLPYSAACYPTLQLGRFPVLVHPPTYWRA